MSKGHNLTRGDNSGNTKNTRQLFFHEESIHEVSRRYLEHEYIHTDKPKPICPPLFQSWGHNDGLLPYGPQREKMSLQTKNLISEKQV